MSIENDRYTDTNGYVLVYKPQHRKAMLSGVFQGYVYEHVLMAEEMIDRGIKEGEVVHHLDSNRSNNSPDNLLVISNPMHAKLHSWMRKHEIIPTEKQKERISLGCIRCPSCQKPTIPTQKYCSAECRPIKDKTIKTKVEREIKIKQEKQPTVFLSKRKYEHPDKDTLQELVWSKPTTALAKDFQVSDVAIAKLCKKLEVEKPPRGYWAKKQAEENK